MNRKCQQLNSTGCNALLLSGGKSLVPIMRKKEGSEGYDKMHSAASVVDGVVVSGHFSGTWNGAASSGGYDFAVVKLFSNGTVAWRWQVNEGILFARQMAESL